MRFSITTKMIIVTLDSFMAGFNIFLYFSYISFVFLKTYKNLT